MKHWVSLETLWKQFDNVWWLWFTVTHRHTQKARFGALGISIWIKRTVHREITTRHAHIHTVNRFSVIGLFRFHFDKIRISFRCPNCYGSVFFFSLSQVTSLAATAKINHKCTRFERNKIVKIHTIHSRSLKINWTFPCTIRRPTNWTQLTVLPFVSHMSSRSHAYSLTRSLTHSLAIVCVFARVLLLFRWFHHCENIFNLCVCVCVCLWLGQLNIMSAAAQHRLYDVRHSKNHNNEHCV